MKITEYDISEALSQVLEEEKDRIGSIVRSHFTEGDDDSGADDSSDDSSDDDSGSDDGGDMDMDMGGSDGGDSGSDGESEEADPEEEINKMSDKVSQGFNAPKNLILDDGTSTGVAVDSSDQVEPIDQVTDENEVKFEKGNWDTFSQSAQDYSQKVTVIRQTLVPLVEKALIELLENNGTYERESFESTAAIVGDEWRVTTELHYHVDLWIGTDFDKEAIQHDSGYIYQTISAIPNIKIMSTKIDTSTGDVQVIASI